MYVILFCNYIDIIIGRVFSLIFGWKSVDFFLYYNNLLVKNNLMLFFYRVFYKLKLKIGNSGFFCYLV